MFRRIQAMTCITILGFLISNHRGREDEHSRKQSRICIDGGIVIAKRFSYIAVNKGFANSFAVYNMKHERIPLNSSLFIRLRRYRKTVAIIDTSLDVGLLLATDNLQAVVMECTIGHKSACA